MSDVASDIPAELFRTFRDADQAHVFRFWESLEGDQKQDLLQQLRSIDLQELAEFSALSKAPTRPRGGELTPPSITRLASLGERAAPAETSSRETANERGEELLRAGRCGVFLVAGGQGTRLGFEGPKGALSVGPLSQKSLFQLHAEKIRRLGEVYGVCPPWYILTSEANDAATRSFFDRHAFFGLSREDVFFLKQSMNPALDQHGRLILESPHRLAVSPNGHGGSYRAFSDGGGLADARRRGLEHIFYFQVDNPLIRIPDPLFLGLHDHQDSDYSLKVLKKTGPDERVGIVALSGGRHCVVEYSDLTKEEATARSSSGELLHWAGTIAIHLFRLDFMERVAQGTIPLPEHVARKSIRGIDPNGHERTVDGFKFETFVFDSLPHANEVLYLEVHREREFAPIKNATGVDSLESAQQLYMSEHRRWLEAAGIEITGKVEVSPTVALDEHELAAALEGLSTEKRYTGDVVVDRDAAGSVRLETRQQQEV